VAAKSRQFTANKSVKDQFLQGNRKNMVGEGVVRKSSSLQRVLSVSNLCNSWSQGAGNMGNGECCSGFGKRVCLFISRKSNMTEDPLEA